MESVVAMLFVFGLGYALLKGLDALKGKPPQKICVDCQLVSSGEERVGGSGCLELVLWMCFIVPGLLYTVWRRTSGLSVVCPSCGGKLIGLDTPRGYALGRQQMDAYAQRNRRFENSEREREEDDQ